MGVLKRTSVLVPASALTNEARYQVHCQSKWLVLKLAQEDPAIFDYDYSLRAMTGLDLGLARMDFAETVTATGGTTVATYEASLMNVGANNAARRDRVIVVHGLVVASSVDSITSIRWVIGGARTHEWFLGSQFSDDPTRQSVLDRTLYVYPPPAPEWIDPVQIPSGASVLVEFYVRNGTAVGIQPSDIVFLGDVAEPIGGGGSGLSLGG